MITALFFRTDINLIADSCPPVVLASPSARLVKFRNLFQSKSLPVFLSIAINEKSPLMGAFVNLRDR